MPPDQTRPVTPKQRAKRGWKALWSCRVGETPAVYIPAVSGTNRTEQHVILACGGLSPGVCSECLLGWPVFSSYGTTDDLSSPSGCCARAATCPQGRCQDITRTNTTVDCKKKQKKTQKLWNFVFCVFILGTVLVLSHQSAVSCKSGRFKDNITCCLFYKLKKLQILWWFSKSTV